MSQGKKVSAVVVNWNGMEFLPSCLESIFSQSYSNLEVIVVDCASRDESVAFIRKDYPLARIIELKCDLGPPYAINLAARQVKGDLILILNNDVILPDNMLSRLVDRMDGDEDCVLNPAEIHWKGEYVGSGCYCTWIGRFLYKFLRLEGTGPFYPSTACCLVPKKVVLNNPLNENLFMYEDTEWGWRLNLNGVRLKAVNHTWFFHRSSGSESAPYSPKQAFLIGRAVLATCFICFRLYTLVLLSPVLMANFVNQILRYAKRGKFSSVQAYLRGYLDALLKVRRFAGDRKQVQKERKIGDLQILKIMIGSVDFARKTRKDWENNGRLAIRVNRRPCKELVCE